MTKLEDIETAIAQLSAEDLARLRDWLEEFEGRVLDERLEQDAKAGRRGKLAKLAAEALADHKAGRSRQLRSIGQARPSGRPMRPCRPASARSRTRALLY